MERVSVRGPHSVIASLRDFQICMIQHFYDNDVSSLCCQSSDVKKRISKLSDETIAEIRSLASIAKYLKVSSEVTHGNDKLSNEEFKVNEQLECETCKLDSLNKHR